MATKLNIPLPSKGLVVDRPAEYADSRSHSGVKNMEYNRAIIRKRIGTAAIGSSLGEGIQRFFELQVDNTTRLFRVGITKVEVLNKSTDVWSSVATAALTGLITDPIDFAFPLLSAVKIAVYTNGVDVIKKCSITGNDAALGGSPPKVKFLQAFNSYLVTANIVDDGSGNSFAARVQWPQTANPESWTGGNSGSVDLLEDPEDITGVGLFGNLLTVHKANSIYVGQVVTTSAIFRFDRKATGVGTVANATIANIPTGEQIFLAADGLHLFNGITAPLVDSPIQDEMREEMNPASITKSQGLFVEELDEYWVCVPLGSDTVPQTIYKYNYRTKQMYKDARTNLTAMGIFINSSEPSWDDKLNTWNSDTTRWNSAINLSLNPVVIVGDSAGVAAERTATSNDDAAVAVEAISDTKDFTAEDLGVSDIDRLVRWKGMEVWMIGNTCKVSYSIDEGTTFTLIDTLTLGSSYPTDSAPLNLYFDVISSKIRFRFQNSVSEESFTLKKYQIEASLRESRK